MNQVVQIAGLHDSEELDLLLNSGVDYIGFPLRLAVHPEDLSEKTAAALIQRILPPAKAVLITYLRHAHEIAEFAEQLGVSVVQLHGDIQAVELKMLKSIAPSLTVIKSVIVRGNNQNDLITEIAQTSLYVDAFITDTFDPKTGATGATGKTHDWEIDREIVRASPKPVIMAGGLNPENVAEAIHFVRPAGVDCHTGVEDRSGRKCPHLVSRLVTEARKAFLSANVSV